MSDTTPDPVEAGLAYQAQLREEFGDDEYERKRAEFLRGTPSETIPTTKGEPQ